MVREEMTGKKGAGLGLHDTIAQLYGFSYNCSISGPWDFMSTLIRRIIGLIFL
jgi:hypothetical protein